MCYICIAEIKFERHLLHLQGINFQSHVMIKHFIAYTALQTLTRLLKLFYETYLLWLML